MKGKRKNDWAHLVRGGESLTVEFKQKVPKLARLARTFSAFANSSGGTVFFGVEDDGHVLGLEHVDGTRELANQVADFFCKPSIELETHQWEPFRGQVVLVVRIRESEEKPVYAVNPNDPKDAWPFFRSNKENLPMDRHSLRTMRRSSAIEFDETEIADLDRHTLRLMNSLHESPRQTIHQLGRVANISSHRAKKILVELERKGWVYSYFNEKRREFSLCIPWRRR